MPVEVRQLVIRARIQEKSQAKSLPEEEGDWQQKRASLKQELLAELRRELKKHLEP